MNHKRFATICVIAALAAGRVQPVHADSLGAGLVGGVLGGIIGGAIVNEGNKQRAQGNTTRYVAVPTMSSAQRAQNVEVQTALNYFGFPVGAADGVLGQQSRAQISQYQAFLGYPATGELSEFQRTLLVTSYNRAIAGGPATMQAAAANPMGVRGLLLTYRDEMAGVSQPAAPAATLMAQPAQPVQPAPSPAPAQGTVSAGLPAFGAAVAAKATLSAQCDQLGLSAAWSTPRITLANMSDPNAALAEQMCLARNDAIAQGNDLASKVQGFTPDQITQQCQGFGPAMQGYVAELATKPRDAVLQDVNGFIGTTGMAPAQLEATAKICLSVGYKTDAMDVAIGSGLILVALGDKPYAELMGHHLSQGVGVPRHADMALDWYKMALDSLSAGQASVFMPTQADRAALIRKAAFAAAGVPAAQAQPAALPSFALPATTTAAAQPAAPVPGDAGGQKSTVEGLPLAARLPFLLFRP